MTLSISDIKKSGKEVETIIYIYLLVTILCAAFGAVYELFSHGVFSYYMLYAFGVPLLGGVLPFYCLYYFRRRIPGTISRRFQHFGVSTVTVGCIFNGILEIYGTTNRLTNIYIIIGGMFLILGVFLYCLKK